MRKTEFHEQLCSLADYADEHADIAFKAGNIELCDRMIVVFTLCNELLKALEVVTSDAELWTKNGGGE